MPCGRFSSLSLRAYRCMCVFKPVCFLTWGFLSAFNKKNVLVQADRVVKNYISLEFSRFHSIALTWVQNRHKLNTSPERAFLAPSLQIDNAPRNVTYDLELLLPTFELSSLHVSIQNHLDVKHFVQACRPMKMSPVQHQSVILVNSQKERFTYSGCQVYITMARQIKSQPTGNEFQMHGKRFYIDTDLDVSGLGLHMPTRRPVVPSPAPVNSEQNLVSDVLAHGTTRASKLKTDILAPTAGNNVPAAVAPTPSSLPNTPNSGNSDASLKRLRDNEETFMNSHIEWLKKQHTHLVAQIGIYTRGGNAPHESIK